jgi:hypothetical protein
MPKPIDSIGPRPEKKQVKPIAEHKAGEVVRPKGSATRAGETVKPKAYVDPHQHETKSNTFVEHSGIRDGKKPKPHRERWYKKLTKKQKLAMGSALVLVLGLGALVWYLSATSQFLTSLNKPRPAAGVFAEVGGETVSESDYGKVKDSYEAFYKKNSESDSALAGQAATKLLSEGLALRAEAKKQNIECSQDIVDKRLTDRYAERGGKDQYYAYMQTEYGWDATAVYWQECSDYLRQQLGSLVGGTDVYGVYIRWDIHKDSDTVTREAFEEAAKNRLETDYLPLLKTADTSVDDIERKVDINKYMTEAEFDSKMASPDQPYTRSMTISRFNAATYAQMEKYNEGEDDLDYVSQLDIGDTTPVFKSKVGYYVVYHALSKTNGQYQSLDDLIASYVQSGKYSNTYYQLPPPTNENNIDVYNITNKQSSLDTMRDMIAPKASAADPNSIQCFWGTHGLPFSLEYRDYNTKALIPLSASTGASVVVASTTNVAWPCKDEPAAGSYYGGSVTVGYTPGNPTNWADPNASRISFFINPHANNPWNYTLSCYTAWRHYLNPPKGYQSVNYGDRNQFEVLISRNWGVEAHNVASAESDNFRVPTTLYSGVANGVNGYTIRVYLRPDVIPEPPKMTVNGYKINELGKANGPYSDNVISLDSGAKTSTDNPYSMTGVRSDQNHSITAADEPGFDLVGYRVNYGAVVASKTYNYTANAVADKGSIQLDWVYRPKFAGTLTMSCSTITGSVTGPSGASIYIRIDGTEVARVSGSSISYTVADDYRDGLSRTVRLYADYMGQSFLLDTESHRCNPNAVCSSADFTQISGAVDAGQSYRVTLQFTNNGEAYWKDYAPNNQYRLAMTDGSQGFDVMSSSLEMPLNTLVKTTQYTAFTVLLTAKNAVTTPTIRVAFQMTRADGATLNNFGTICEATTRFRSQYSPWLRTQNGNVSALGIIVGQGSLKVDGASLGGRRNVGTASGASKDDLNYEATYLAMAQKQNSVGVIGAAISDNGPFCSTNAYVLGRDTEWTTSDNSASCSFGAYAFRLRHNLADGLKKSGTEVIFKQTKLSYNDAPDACPAAGPNPTGDSRYVKGATSYNGSLNLPGLNGLCPTITILNKNLASDTWFTLGTPRHAANPPKELTPNGRTTILVDGDLYINANIRNGALPAVTFSRNDFIGLNALPNLGIIVSGDIIVDRDVTQIDASLYAAGKIKTCDLYDPSVTGPDSTTTTTGFKTEQSPVPTAANTTAKLCSSNTLSIHGLAVAKGGFMFGRNYLDFTGIGSRIGQSQFAAGFELHPDRSLYFGKPAEDVVYNGLMLIAPPPGFEHVSNPDFSTARYTNDDVQPRF